MSSRVDRPDGNDLRASTGRPADEAALAHLVDHPASRRQMLAMAAVGGAGIVLAGQQRADAVPIDGPYPVGAAPRRAHLTVMGTADTHGNALNWDYYKDAEFTDADGNDIGLAKIATLVKGLRAERGHRSCLLLDAGDTIQGTPLAYYYARIAPISDTVMHPMAKAMNAMGFDAAALGNHEFNYGLDTLRTYQSQLAFPLLCGNALDWSTGDPVFPRYLIREMAINGYSRPVKVGILGLVTPGVAIWDKANVEGRVRFGGIVEQGKLIVPRLKAAGCDLVIVACHSGSTFGSSYGDALPYAENASGMLARRVPGIDAILVGHAHAEIPQRWITNEVTGKKVLLSEPKRWGMRLTVMDFELAFGSGRWEVTSSAAQLYDANTVPEDPRIARLVRDDHDIVRTYVNSVVGSSTSAMSAATARFEDTAALDFINLVQADAVKAALAGSPQAGLPVLSIAAPFNRDAAIPEGNVTVRDVAGLYIFDNTLLGITLTGAQVLDYLETSAAYFKQVADTGPFAPDDITNGINPTTHQATPDYNYDVMNGLDASLSYDIDIAHPVGSRITGLSYDGTPVEPGQEFVIAINNYRQSGGGGFPHVATAPVVYNAQVEIRQLIIDWVSDQVSIDPPSFTVYDWRLTANGEPVQVEGAVEGGR